MSLWKAAIAVVDWSAYNLASGPATGYGERLAALIAELLAGSPGPARHDELWFEVVENQVVSQNTVYSAAEPTVGVVLAALSADLPSHLQGTLLEILIVIANGAVMSHNDLGRRCLAAVARGAWLLAREAERGSPGFRADALEILDLCAPECARALRMAE